MGIGKADGEYIEEMTEPAGWPDIDESSIRDRADAMLLVRNETHFVCNDWKSHHGQIFASGSWSGNAANAANNAVAIIINTLAGMASKK